MWPNERYTLTFSVWIHVIEYVNCKIWLIRLLHLYIITTKRRFSILENEAKNTETYSSFSRSKQITNRWTTSPFDSNVQLIVTVLNDTRLVFNYLWMETTDFQFIGVSYRYLLKVKRACIFRDYFAFFMITIAIVSVCIFCKCKFKFEMQPKRDDDGK